MVAATALARIVEYPWPPCTGGLLSRLGHRGPAAILAKVNYAQLLFPNFSLILCGYLVCRYTALNRTVWGQVESLVYYFLFPVLLFALRWHICCQSCRGSADA